MKKFGLVLISFIFIFACSEETAKDEVIIDTVSSFEVTGMVCEMGCGGAIRKELQKSEAVNRVEVDFEEESLSNIIKVYHSSAAIKENEVVSTIETINDGQFEATFIESAPHEEKEAEQAYTDRSKNNETSLFSSEESCFSLPNLSDILNGLIY